VELFAVRLTAARPRAPERCPLGDDLGGALRAERKAFAPAGYVVRAIDLDQLSRCADLVLAPRAKHQAVPLARLMLGHEKVPVVRGSHISVSQLLRSLRALLARAVERRERNIYIVGVGDEVFAELWTRAPSGGADRGGSRPARAAEPARAANAGNAGLLELLPALPVPDAVRTRYVGASLEIQLVHQLILRAAAQEEPVLILGDTGTGKEVVARLVHDQSPRRLATFTPVNCGAIPRELLEAELFGYEKGAHSTATTRKPGLWEITHGGTLFLDEIADLSLDHQVKVLRAIDLGEVRPVGAVKSLQVNARVVAATNRDLFGAVRARRFREDLYYRLRALMIYTPALRDHPDDIPELADHLWRQTTRDPEAELPGELHAELKRYRWPGNARELKLVLATLFGLFGRDDLTARHVQAVFQFAGQVSGESEATPAHEVAQHRIDCLRHLRRVDEALRACEVTLRSTAAESDEGRGLLRAAIARHVGELEVLTAHPVLFHGHATFHAVERLLESLGGLRDTLGGATRDGSRRELNRELNRAQTAVFAEVSRILEST
jgi:DNA-binding NtrC family response regulator